MQKPGKGKSPAQCHFKGKVAMNMQTFIPFCMRPIIFLEQISGSGILKSKQKAFLNLFTDTIKLQRKTVQIYTPNIHFFTPFAIVID